MVEVRPELICNPTRQRIEQLAAVQRQRPPEPPECPGCGVQIVVPGPQGALGRLQPAEVEG